MSYCVFFWAEQPPYALWVEFMHRDQQALWNSHIHSFFTKSVKSKVFFQKHSFSWTSLPFYFYVHSRSPFKTGLLCHLGFVRNRLTTVHVGKMTPEGTVNILYCGRVEIGDFLWSNLFETDSNSWHNLRKFTLLTYSARTCVEIWIIYNITCCCNWSRLNLCSISVLLVIRYKRKEDINMGRCQDGDNQIAVKYNYVL